MNVFIKTQCKTMLLSCKSFKDGVHLASLKDDGYVSKEEMKIIKEIERATEQYEKEINKILYKYK